jgi:hypothetical protein
LNDTKESHNNSSFKNGFFATFFFRLKLMEKSSGAGFPTPDYL